MSHSHSHSHNHNHNINLKALHRSFILGIVINLIFVAVEFGAGFWYDSLALISDAGHNLSDVVSLVLALIAFKLSQMIATKRFTYSYKKSTILVSLLNALLLLGVVFILIYKSIYKLNTPSEVEGLAIAWVAGAGILVNGFTAFLLLKDKDHDLNVKGAYLHMIADTLVSVGVFVSGIIIHYTDWFIIDPIIGIIVAIIILFSTWGLLSESIRLALDGVPQSINPEEIEKEILNIKGVLEIHHLHIWAMSTTENALTAHIVVGSDSSLQTIEHIKQDLRQMLMQHNINHPTFEFEHPQEDCQAYDDTLEHND